VPVDPPRDVRLAVKVADGLWQHVRLFEAAGEAVCHGANREPLWELRNLGLPTGARVLGHLLGLVWLESGWWRTYGELTGKSQRPGPTEVQTLRGARVLIGLLRLRIQGVVMPVVRAALAGRALGGSGSEVSADQRPPAVPEIFAGLIRGQLGLQLDAGWDLAYLDQLELAPLVRPFDLQSYVLAHMLLERLRRTFGDDWFKESATGPGLLKTLCSAGTGPTAQQLAVRLGFEEGLDFGAPLRTFKKAWELSSR
jgi:hypothetical protein